MDILGYVTGVSHVGIAVPDIDTAEKQYQLLGFVTISNEKIGEKDFGVKTKLMRMNEYTIELLEPYEKGQESPIDRYISSKPYKMYHLAYYVSDFQAQIDLLQKNKYVMINEPKPSKSMDGRMSVFMFNRSMGIIELIKEA